MGNKNFLKLNMDKLKDLTLVNQGAEAKIYLGKLNDKSVLVKERFSKKYRIKEIDDKLSKDRFYAEVRYLNKCNNEGILTPKVVWTDKNERGFLICMEKLEGSTAKDFISLCLKKENSYDKCIPVVKKLGEAIARLHDISVVHGDLTTSNLFLVDPSLNEPQSKKARIEDESNDDFKVYLIDFGLGFHSEKAYDKGTDLYVLERAFLSTHPDSKDLFLHLMEAYKSYPVTKQDTKLVILKFEEVRMKGRKRQLF